MGTFAQRWVSAAMIMAAVGGARSASAQTAALSVDIRDWVGNSESVLRETRDGLRDIFRDAGVEVISEGAPRFIIYIVTHRMARQLTRRVEFLGFAPMGPGAHIAYVLDEEVSRAARAARFDKSSLLAAAIAHELGHLLLPPPAHGANGIMRAGWDDNDFRRAAQGNLRFLSDQARQLRESLTKSPQDR
jgi:hypothetical protein